MKPLVQVKFLHSDVAEDQNLFSVLALGQGMFLAGHVNMWKQLAGLLFQSMRRKHLQSRQVQSSMPRE